MAIAVNNSSTYTTTIPNNTPFSHAYVVGSGSNRLLVVTVSLNDGSSNNPEAFNVTYGGVAMTYLYNVGQAEYGHAFQGVFYLVNPASGSNNIVVTPSSIASTTNVVIGMVDFTGVDQVSPLETDAGAGQTYHGYHIAPGNPGHLTDAPPIKIADANAMLVVVHGPTISPLQFGVNQTSLWNLSFGAGVAQIHTGCSTAMPGTQISFSEDYHTSGDAEDYWYQMVIKPYQLFFKPIIIII